MNSTLKYIDSRLEFLDKVQKLAIKDGDQMKTIETSMLLCELLDVKIKLTKELYAKTCLYEPSPN